MVCKPCQFEHHHLCIELKRQLSDASDTDKKGSFLCDCQHGDR
jgi:hypothetical protein